MRIADEILDTLQRALEGWRVPRVAGLHLPPAPWNQRKDGEFGAIELDDGSLGLSYVLLDDTLARMAADRDRESSLLGRDALEVAHWWTRSPGTRHTLGFAAVNALSRHLFDRVGFVPPSAHNSIGGLDPQPGEHIGMIGFFPPLVKQVTACGARLTVLELRTDLAGDYADHRVTLDAAELASCSKVLSTSTVLLNDTLDSVLDACRSASVFAMIGPGASFVPDPPFARGVTFMGGVWIEDPDAFKRALTTGEHWSTHARKFAIERAHYPGIDALLAAAAW